MHAACRLLRPTFSNTCWLAGACWGRETPAEWEGRVRLERRSSSSIAAAGCIGEVWDRPWVKRVGEEREGGAGEGRGEGGVLRVGEGKGGERSWRGSREEAASAAMADACSLSSKEPGCEEGGSGTMAESRECMWASETGVLGTRVVFITVFTLDVCSGGKGRVNTSWPVFKGEEEGDEERRGET